MLMHLLYCRMAVDTDYCKSLIVSHNNTPSLFSSVHCGILEEYDHPYNEESIQIKYIFRFSNNTRRIKALKMRALVWMYLLPTSYLSIFFIAEWEYFMYGLLPHLYSGHDCVSLVCLLSSISIFSGISSSVDEARLNCRYIYMNICTDLLTQMKC